MEFRQHDLKNENRPDPGRLPGARERRQSTRVPSNRKNDPRGVASASSRGLVRGGGPFRAYLGEIAAIPLLSETEEIELAKRRELGDADAKRRLIEANLRLVVSEAKRYACPSHPLPDLVQEGNIGLMGAVDRFDWRRGHRFATYAIWWVRSALLRAVSETPLLRLPLGMAKTLNRLRRMRGQMAQQLGREPSRSEVEREMGRLPDEIWEAEQAVRVPLSLEGSAGDDGPCLADLLLDTNGRDPEDTACAAMLRLHLVRLLNALPTRHRRVLVLRFGLSGGRPRSLAEIADLLGVTRTRAWQLEAKALKGLRRLDRLHGSLREFAS